MKILLIAINSKYIHSNLAVYSIKAYTEQHCHEEKAELIIKEYTINQQKDDILMDIYKEGADILSFSCYIWNIDFVTELVGELKKVKSGTEIWLGGPEVSFDTINRMEGNKNIDLIMEKEGEETFLELVEGKERKKVKGITYRDSLGKVQRNSPREIMDMSRIPFVYEDMSPFENKIIYYESSRGCPFSCSYCLSSVDKKLRFRETNKVLNEIKKFLEMEISQVKFVDRTFNCNPNHSREILKFIQKNDNRITNFHFEIGADLLREEDFQIIEKMRPGQIQFEIGVQSTNEDTLKEIRRVMNFDQVAACVRRIKEYNNTHLHLDLIAGLPFEGVESFKRSFNMVYDLHPEQLQLGFLKVLKGSFMEENAKEYQLTYKSHPPYEVLSTKWLSYDEVINLKNVENVLEIYYNSGQYRNTIGVLEKEFPTYYDFYSQLGAFYEEQGYSKGLHKRGKQYEILLDFVSATMNKDIEEYRELLTLDYYLRENAKSRPEFSFPPVLSKDEVAKFYEEESSNYRYLENYQGYDKNQMRKMTHLEKFPLLGKTYLFDYRRRNPMNYEARTWEI
ncbi:radical SAM superfamily enzyme YgiQ (UPF0313 family) [Aequitasia blattaphilus]|uniref:B12-binding domain-containing radical SAM protein n=1 Tax=Aequitasia blattaphilus TaxID=2949332 RepID=A0ABT1E5B4_9FIRM|nr:B12-binding domain-containing radical SAM protein [Aequitasia blattaphilus]MCP1100938.1 B12-binding domain-containing radical SAM protein [Aequitasia blattaphilus]MCR8613578.1 B12-binding domain-containing radical SAM protein [Aequitasia blattaphilus]